MINVKSGPARGPEQPVPTEKPSRDKEPAPVPAGGNPPAVQASEKALPAMPRKTGSTLARFRARASSAFQQRTDASASRGPAEPNAMATAVAYGKFLPPLPTFDPGNAIPPLSSMEKPLLDLSNRNSTNFNKFQARIRTQSAGVTNETVFDLVKAANTPGGNDVSKIAGQGSAHAVPDL